MRNPVVARDLHFRVGGISPTDIGLTLPGSGTSLLALVYHDLAWPCLWLWRWRLNFFCIKTANEASASSILLVHQGRVLV